MSNSRFCLHVPRVHRLKKYCKGAQAWGGCTMSLFVLWLTDMCFHSCLMVKPHPKGILLQSYVCFLCSGWPVHMWVGGWEDMKELKAVPLPTAWYSVQKWICEPSVPLWKSSQVIWNAHIQGAFQKHPWGWFKWGCGTGFSTRISSSPTNCRVLRFHTRIRRCWSLLKTNHLNKLLIARYGSAEKWLMKVLSYAKCHGEHSLLKINLTGFWREAKELQRLAKKPFMFCTGFLKNNLQQDTQLRSVLEVFPGRAFSPVLPPNGRAPFSILPVPCSIFQNSV